jgi:hypothetical protein
MGNIKSNPIHIFSSFFFFVWRAHKDIECSLFCAPSRPMSLSTEVDFSLLFFFLRSLLLPLKEKLEKEIEKIDSQTHAKGCFYCSGESHIQRKITHTTTKPPSQTTPDALLDDFPFHSRGKLFSLSRCTFLRLHVCVCALGVSMLVVYEIAFHLFRIAEHGKISLSHTE